MAESDEDTFLKKVLYRIGGGVGIVVVYLLYRFLRPYWYAMRIRDWLQVEQDYFKDFSRTLHPLGFYEFEVHLREGGDPEIIIENRSRRVPVIIRGQQNFSADVLGNLLRRADETEANRGSEDLRLFLEEVEWALNTAPGVGRYVNQEGEVCSAEDAVGVVIEYRIYPDAVSQHEIIDSVVEIGSTFRMIRQRGEKFTERLQDGQ